MKAYGRATTRSEGGTVYTSITKGRRKLVQEGVLLL
jgi:hypothetical protein